jgi:hypothetical protein
MLSDGGPVQVFNGDEVFRGVGADEAKSRLLLSVSVQPPPPRIAEVVFEIVGAAPAPSKKFALPYPTKSTIFASAAGPHGVELPLQPKGVVVFTRATFPAPAAIAMGVASMTSGVGKGDPTAAWEASWTKKYWPGARVTAGNSVINVEFAPKLPVPVALVY